MTLLLEGRGDGHETSGLEWFSLLWRVLRMMMVLWREIAWWGRLLRQGELMQRKLFVVGGVGEDGESWAAKSIPWGKFQSGSNQPPTTTFRERPRNQKEFTRRGLWIQAQLNNIQLTPNIQTTTFYRCLTGTDFSHFGAILTASLLSPPSKSCKALGIERDVSNRAYIFQGNRDIALLIMAKVLFKICRSEGSKCGYNNVM